MLDAGQDVVCEFGSAEGLGDYVVCLDEGADVGLECLRGVINASSEMLPRDQCEVVFDLIDS